MRNIIYLTVFLGHAAFAGDPLSIKVKGQSFSSDGEIEIYFKNESEKNLTYVGISLERYENEEWSVYRYDIGCSCTAKVCKNSTKHFIPDKLQYLKWDIDGKNCQVPQPGLYRFSVFGDQLPNLDQPKYLGVSNKFSIDR